MKALGLVCALLLSTLLFGTSFWACAPEENSPEQTAQRFLRSVREGDTAEVYALLDPVGQELLSRQAQLANAQAGGGHRIKPGDLLVVGQELPRSEVSEVRLLKIVGERATVRLANNKIEETLELVRVKGVWRVLLPRELLVQGGTNPGVEK